jgi:hypothetical protein
MNKILELLKVQKRIADVRKQEVVSKVDNLLLSAEQCIASAIHELESSPYQQKETITP